MHPPENCVVQAICLRLVQSLSPARSESIALAQWIFRNPSIFGPMPEPVLDGRFRQSVGRESWDDIADHLAHQIAACPLIVDQSRLRLEAISARLELCPIDYALAHILVLKARDGAVSDLINFLQREIGLSVEAALGWCCNLDESEVWTALSANGRLIILGVILPVGLCIAEQDEAYPLSGLLLSLLHGQAQSDLDKNVDLSNR